MREDQLNECSRTWREEKKVTGQLVLLLVVQSEERINFHERVRRILIHRQHCRFWKGKEEPNDSVHLYHYISITGKKFNEATASRATQQKTKRQRPTERNNKNNEAKAKQRAKTAKRIKTKKEETHRASYNSMGSCLTIEKSMLGYLSTKLCDTKAGVAGVDDGGCGAGGCNGVGGVGVGITTGGEKTGTKTRQRGTNRRTAWAKARAWAYSSGPPSTSTEKTNDDDGMGCCCCSSRRRWW